MDTKDVTALKESIKKLFPLNHWQLTRTSLTKNSDTSRALALYLEKEETKSRILVISVPKAFGRVYYFRGSTKCIIHRGLPAAGYKAHRGNLDYVNVQSPEQVLTSELKRIITIAVCNDKSNEWCQYALDTWFNTSPLLRLVDPEKPLTIKSETNAILLDIGEDMTDREIVNWEYRLDILSTTQNEKICRVFRLAAGAKVEDGRIIEGESLLSDINRENLVFPESNRPHRLLPMRPAFQTHEKLVKPEYPTITSNNYFGELSGTHLTTAIMDLGVNYDDAFVISESAAEKLDCYVVKKHDFELTGDYDLSIEESDVIGPRGFALLHDDRRMYLENRYDAHIQEIKEFSTSRLGRTINIVRVRYSMIYHTKTGDKLTQRAGNKGILLIRADDKMPKNLNGDPIDIVMHPKSIISRRSMGIFREMMANLKYKGKHKAYDHFSGEDTFRDLVKEGFGKKSKILDREVEREVFIAPLFWIRTSSHAIDKLAAVGDRKPKDFRGLNPDNGKTGGQRINMGIGNVLIAKGLGSMYQELMDKNVEPSAVESTRQIYEFLTWKGI